MNPKKLTALLLAVTLLASCSGLTVHHYSDARYAPTTQVDVYLMTNIPPPHTEFGEIRWDAPATWSDEELIDALKEKAMAAGANGLKNVNLAGPVVFGENAGTIKQIKA